MTFLQYSLIAVGAIFFFIILLLIGLNIISGYKRKPRAVASVNEAGNIDRRQAKEEAAEIISNIVSKVFDAEGKNLEAAKERAAGRTTAIIETLRGPEIEEVIGKAIDKLSERQIRKKAEYRQNSISYIQDMIDRIRYIYGEKELDDVVSGVVQRLNREESGGSERSEGVDIETPVETLERLKEKLRNEINRKK